jgi:hypothetical protein
MTVIEGTCAYILGLRNHIKDYRKMLDAAEGQLILSMQARGGASVDYHGHRFRLVPHDAAPRVTPTGTNLTILKRRCLAYRSIEGVIGKPSERRTWRDNYSSLAADLRIDYPKRESVAA